MVAEPLERAALKTLAGACALTLALPGCRDASVRVPPLPPFRSQSQASISAFRDADRLARGSPDSADFIGRLGMLYHAYQFLHEGRVCYEIARERAPDEFRWVYYQGKLEKTAFQYEASEALFRRALEMRPRDAELWAELGELYAMWGRRDDAAKPLEKALELDPIEPTAALAKARLLSIEQKWQEIVALLTPLMERQPRLSAAHRYLAAAYSALGIEDKRAFHQELGEYGTARRKREDEGAQRPRRCGNPERRSRARRGDTSDEVLPLPQRRPDLPKSARTACGGHGRFGACNVRQAGTG